MGREANDSAFTEPPFVQQNFLEQALFILRSPSEEGLLFCVNLDVQLSFSTLYSSDTKVYVTKQTNKMCRGL